MVQWANCNAEIAEVKELRMYEGQEGFLGHEN